MFSLLEGFSSMLTLIRSPGHNSVQPQTLAYNAALHACFLSNVPRNGNCRKERLWCCGDVLCLSLQIWKEGCPWNKASQIVCLTVTELRSLTFKLRAGNITSAWQEAIETFAAGWRADESDTVSMQALLEAILGAGEFRRATTVTMFPPSWTLQISPWKTWWLRGVPSSSRMRQWKKHWVQEIYVSWGVFNVLPVDDLFLYLPKTCHEMVLSTFLAVWSKPNGEVTTWMMNIISM